MNTDKTEFNVLKKLVEEGIKTGNELVDAENQFNLGYFFYIKKGTDENLTEEERWTEAEKWFRKAETFLSTIDFEKYEYAKNLMGRVKFYLSVICKNSEESKVLFQEAIKLESIDAKLNVIKKTNTENKPIEVLRVLKPTEPK